MKTVTINGVTLGQRIMVVISIDLKTMEEGEKSRLYTY